MARRGYEWWPGEGHIDDPGEDTGDWRGPDGEGGKYGFKYKFINKPLIYFPEEKKWAEKLRNALP